MLLLFLVLHSKTHIFSIYVTFEYMVLVFTYVSNSTLSQVELYIRLAGLQSNTVEDFEYLHSEAQV